MNRLFLLTLLAALLISACSSGGGDIQRVTALPDSALTVTPTAMPAPPLDPNAAQQPTSALDALLASAPREATPTPLSNNLPAGNAMQIAAATDTAMTAVPLTPMAFDAFPVKLSFDEFYNGYNIRTGLVLSDKLLSLDGQQVIIEGYMAPPLKPELDYFVLTRVKLAFCPFCSTGGDWPDDIALVYMINDPVSVTERPVRLLGRLEVGASIDRETGMVSLVRVYAEKLEVLN